MNIINTMIIRYYIVFLIVTVISAIIALVTKNKNLAFRTMTSATILHIWCFVLWGGQYTFLIFIALVLSLSAYEMASF